MRVGVIYLWHPRKRINGTLFYCAEYYAFLRQFTDIEVNFYIVGISPNDEQFVQELFYAKYGFMMNITAIDNYTDVHKLKLDKTLILDIRTFHYLKEFLTNDVHVFANEKHEMFRYQNDRTVTYYGSYDYQDYDVFNYLKLNFGIFPPLKEKRHAVFVSSLNPGHIQLHIKEYEKKFNRPVIIKNSITGFGNIYEMCDHVHYIHTDLDTNNRTIPETFFYDTNISFEDYNGPIDSVVLRYTDIKKNGLGNYTLTAKDEMIKACLK